MPTIKVPEIKIPKIDIPKTPLVPEHVLTGNIPGCNLYHRDLEITKNPSILYNDRNAYITCPEGEMPSFNPIEYDPSKLIKTVTPTQSPQQPEYRPVIPKKKEEKEIVEIPPCPGKKDLRVGSFVNEKRLERVKGYKRGEDGIECITIYEAVEWKDQYIPSAPQFVGVFSLALVGASAPFVLQLVRPIVKQVVTKLTKKKK